MIYRIYPDYPDMTRYPQECLDGDITKVFAIDLTRDEVKILASFSTFSGRSVDTTYLPTLVNIGGPERKLMDISPDGLFSVSKKFKDVVEEFEPDVHQFVPVEFLWGDGAHAGNKYWFFACNRLDTVDRGKTTKDFKIIWDPGSDGEFYFSRSNIDGHHLWQDKFMPAGYGPFASNELHEGLMAASVEGMVVEPLQEVN